MQRTRDWFGRFDREVRYWVSNASDCWELEYLHLLFSYLHDKAVLEDVDAWLATLWCAQPLLVRRLSPLHSTRVPRHDRKDSARHRHKLTGPAPAHLTLRNRSWSCANRSPETWPAASARICVQWMSCDAPAVVDELPVAPVPVVDAGAALAAGAVPVAAASTRARRRCATAAWASFAQALGPPLAAARAARAASGWPARCCCSPPRARRRG